MLARTLLAVERRLRRKVATVEPEKVKQVLVLEYMLPLGTCVHLTPFFEALKLCRPDLAITVATRGMGSQVLRHSPYIDRLIDTPDPLKDLNAAVLFLRSGLRRLRLEPDCVLTGASDQRTRIALMGMFGSGGWRGGSFKSWLFRIVVNLAKNHVRDTSRFDRSEEAQEREAAPVEPFAQAHLEADEQRKQLREAIARLPRRQREVLLLRVDGDLPFAEVATTLGITEVNAKVNFHHAVQKLKGWLKSG